MVNGIKQRGIMLPQGSSGELCTELPAAAVGASPGTERAGMPRGARGYGADLLGKKLVKSTWNGWTALNKIRLFPRV